VSSRSRPPITAAKSFGRALGLRTVVSTSTGLAFAAVEYLAAAGLVVYVAGDSAWIAIGVAGLLALLAWDSSASSMPCSDGGGHPALHEAVHE